MNFFRYGKEGNCVQCCRVDVNKRVLCGWAKSWYGFIVFLRKHKARNFWTFTFRGIGGGTLGLAEISIISFWPENAERLDTIKSPQLIVMPKSHAVWWKYMRLEWREFRKVNEYVWKILNNLCWFGKREKLLNLRNRLGNEFIGKWVGVKQGKEREEGSWIQYLW